MRADDDGADAVVAAVLVPPDPDGVAVEPPREVLQQVERPRQHVIPAQRRQRRHRQPRCDPAQRRIRARREPGAGASPLRPAAARVDQDDAAAAGVVVQRGDGRGVRGGVGGDRPIQQRVERQVVLARRYGGRLRQAGRRAPVHIGRQTLQSGARHAIHPGVARHHIGKARRQGGQVGRLGRHDGQQQDRRGWRQPQQPAQAQRQQQVQRQQRHGQRQQARPQRALPRRARQAGLGCARHGGGNGQGRHGSAEVEGAPPASRAVDPRRMARRHRWGRQVRCRNARRSLRRRGEAAEAVQRLIRRQQRIVGHARHPGGQVNQAAQHVHEQPGQRQVGPVGVARHMEQHHPPLAVRRRRHQRRAVLQPGPGPPGQLRRRLGQHLPGDQHLRRDGQADERGCGREGGQRRRLAPGQGAAQLAVPGQQAHRQQRVGRRVARRPGVLVRHPGRRQARPGEADQQPALAHPGVQRLRLLPIQRHVGQHEHRDVTRQQGLQRALPQLAGGRQGAPGVEQRADQRRVCAGLGGQQPDGAAAPPLVQQRDAAGRHRAVQHQPGQLVAKLRR